MRGPGRRAALARISKAKRQTTKTERLEELIHVNVGMMNKAEEQLIYNAATGKVAKLLQILRSGADAICRDKNKLTPCHYAAMNDQVAAIEVLGDHHQLNYAPCTLEEEASDGSTPLHFAAYYSKWQTVKKVIELHLCNIRKEKDQKKIRDEATLNQSVQSISSLNVKLEKLKLKLMRFEDECKQIQSETQQINNDLSEIEAGTSIKNLEHLADKARIAYEEESSQNQTLVLFRGLRKFPD